MIRVDVVVIGAGMAGASSAWHLAGSGRSVALLERFGPGHDRGSSHGAVRIFRAGYEDPFYASLVAEAYDGWRALEHASGETLLDVTGAVDHGDAAAVARLESSLTAAGVSHRRMEQREAAERWPGHAFTDAILFQERAGRVYADRTVAAMTALAAAAGADVRFHTAVTGLVVEGESVVVDTGSEHWRADVVVAAVGAWTAGLTGGWVPLPELTVTREQVYHFAPVDDRLDWPSVIDRRPPYLYSLYSPGVGLKAGLHMAGLPVDPDSRDMPADPDRRRAVIEAVTGGIPGVEPTPVIEEMCLYTTTATEDFLLDRSGPVVVVSPCSGHGFKFAPLIGSWVSDVVAGGEPPERFRIGG